MIRSLKVERLRPLGRWLSPDVYLWAKAILLALIVIQLARLIWVLVTPVGPFGAWQPTAPRPMSDQAQSAIIASVNPFFRSAATATPAAQPLNLDLQLFGVRESQGALPGSAILGPPDGEQQSFAVGEEVAPGVTLAAVAFDHVVLKQGLSEQRLYMEGAEDAPQAGAAAPSSSAGNVSRAFDLKPRMQGERVTGINVGPGANPALYASAGFKPGDVIVAVNGARISSLIDVQQLQSGIAPGARLLLTVERGAQTVPIALNVPGTP